MVNYFLATTTTTKYKNDFWKNEEERDHSDDYFMQSDNLTDLLSQSRWSTLIVNFLIAFT